MLINAVFRLERFTEVREFTYRGKHFPCVNADTLVNAAKDKGNLTKVKVVITL